MIFNQKDDPAPTAAFDFLICPPRSTGVAGSSQQRHAHLAGENPVRALAWYSDDRGSGLRRRLRSVSWTATWLRCTHSGAGQRRGVSIA